MDNKEYDAGDSGHVKKRKSKFQLAKERNDEELRVLINTTGGAYFIWRLMSECGMYTASPDEPQGMAIHEGKRRIGQWILAELVGVEEELYSKVRNIGSQRQGEM